MPTRDTSLGFEFARAGASKLNFARFEVTDDFQLGGPVVMAYTSADKLGGLGDNRMVQLKDIVVSVVLPLCIQDNTPPPIQTSDIPRVLWHDYTFNIRINGNNTQFPVTFVTNCDRIRSPLVLARLDTAINDISVSVTRDNIDPLNQGIGYFAYLTCVLEFKTYTSVDNA